MSACLDLHTIASTDVPPYLEMPFTIKEEILRFEVTVGNTLAMEVLDAVEELFEAAFDFTWAHATGG
jgi:hypothetical protein